MNEKQQRASKKLYGALLACNTAGLSVGIYDGNICVWPREIDVMQGNVFENCEAHGCILRTPHGMRLDGGAGV